MKLKVCGMKYVENIQQVAELNPDYLGFIFYDNSKRNFEGIIPEFSNSIKKTGVFVNEYVEIVISLVEEYRLDAIQLHGDESVEYIIKLKRQLAENRALFIEENKQIKKKKNQHYISKNEVEIIKVFGIKDEFNFDVLQPYLDVVDFFLFDTKGKERGGNGTKFDWSVLEKYPYDKPFFLSGGIGPKDIEQIQIVRKTNLPIYALDVNSKFEMEPGRKKIEELKEFKKNVITNVVK
ncbi:phosphoribosylanthranilate isomerase [Polaribacter vadi]|uniref:phosphoribosylanthranilate isomerase n=1 Tax=Polaribacter TaxID=52959 RepID=UPI001C08842B|nr:MULTISPECIES: phosphoribosylanthranilate isomerase [Polaribacter]MBU3009813.1 phosphoribosylanthranilate isomerase [Polaribacter vadi]MDO6739618.1 phosphoribosylanthranilate isomerase [Polaribacter sp. 1_MG-2023]